MNVLNVCLFSKKRYVVIDQDNFSVIIILINLQINSDVSPIPLD